MAVGLRVSGVGAVSTVPRKLAGSSTHHARPWVLWRPQQKASPELGSLFIVTAGSGRCLHMKRAACTICSFSSTAVHTSESQEAAPGGPWSRLVQNRLGAKARPTTKNQTSHNRQPWLVWEHHPAHRRAHA